MTTNDLGDWEQEVVKLIDGVLSENDNEYDGCIWAAWDASCDKHGYEARLSAREEFKQMVRERILMGQRQYGLLNPATERRDMAKERREECVDAAVYRAWELVLQRKLAK